MNPSARVDSVEGVVLVENTSVPASSGGEVTVVERWSRPIEGSLEPRRSWEPTPEVRAEGAGRVFVLAPRSGLVSMYDVATGRRLGAIAGEPGPTAGTEGAVGMALLSERLLVARPHNVEVYRLDGSFEKRITLPVRDSQLDRIRQIHRLDSTTALTLEASAGRPAWYEYEPSGHRTAHAKPHGISRYYTSASERECWRVTDGREGPLLLSCFFPVALQLDSVGKVSREVVIQGGADSASASDLRHLRRESRARWRAWNDQLSSEAITARVKRDLRIHSVIDRYREIRYDASSGLVSVLVQKPEYMGGGSAALLLFNDEGVYVARVEFSGYWLGHDLENSVVYAVVRDEDGRRWLRSYRLMVPSDLLALGPQEESGRAREGRKTRRRKGPS